MPTIWLNGNLADDDTAAVPLRDAGLLHAAGVFTTMRSYGGRVFRLGAHLLRLRQSCDALQVPLLYDDATLAAAVADVLGRNDLADARLRLTVTRGAARHDPLHGPQVSPNVFLTAAELQPYPADFYTHGMTVILLDEQKLNPYDIQAGHKTLNYFSRLSALRTAAARGAGEALWFNVHNYLQSSCVANVFVVKDDVVLTPPTADELRDPAVAANVAYPRSATLPGITRATIRDLAGREGIEVRPAAIDVNQLLSADEVFLTNSVMGVMPVCRIEQESVGDGRPGAVASRLAELYAGEVARAG